MFSGGGNMTRICVSVCHKGNDFDFDLIVIVTMILIIATIVMFDNIGGGGNMTRRICVSVCHRGNAL